MDNNFNGQINGQPVENGTPEYDQQLGAAPQPPVDYVPMSSDDTVGVAASENVIAGVVGAFLLSLIGGALYFGIYQIGYIAGICGLIIFVLANWGYKKFSGSNDSKVGVIVSVAMMVVMILLAEYMCLAFEIYNVFKTEFSISFVDALRSTPEFLKEGEVLGAAVKDVLIALVLGVIAAFSSIRSAAKGSNAK